MVSFKYTITDEVGIHARPASLLVKEAKNYTDDIKISCNGKTVDPRKLMALLSIGAKQGQEVVVEVAGENEAETAAKLEEYFKSNL